MTDLKHFIEGLVPGIVSTAILFAIALPLALFFVYVPGLIVTLAGHPVTLGGGYTVADARAIGLTLLLLVPSVMIMFRMAPTLVKDPNWFDGPFYWRVLLTATWVGLVCAVVFGAPKGSTAIAIAFLMAAFALGCCASFASQELLEDKDKKVNDATANCAS